MRLTQALCVFMGAGCGALLRWRITLWLTALSPAYPAGTVAVNLIGCLLIGLVTGYFEVRLNFSPEIRLLLSTGFLGGFTTFSAFSLESLHFLASRTLLALFIIMTKITLCLVLTYFGLFLARRLFTIA